MDEMIDAVKLREECATEGCGRPSDVHFIRGDVGSYYCISCYLLIQAGETERLAALSTPLASEGETK